MFKKVLLAACALSVILPSASNASAPTDAAQRSVEPIVITGNRLPRWSGPAADGVAMPYPSGYLDGKRDAHNGQLAVPPEEAWGPIDPDEVVAYSWADSKWTEIPVQVDERFPYFLANANSDFGIYSGTDKELTYEWDVESWKKSAGECDSAYPEGVTAMQDPVTTLDDDDEVVVMASDAGLQAPIGAFPTEVDSYKQELRITDPMDPTAERFIYLFTRSGGSTFNSDNGYVSYDRDANADQWIDESVFPRGDVEQLGSSNGGYGPNLSGTICDVQRDPQTRQPILDPITGEPIPEVRQSSDRFPRDGVTVSTDKYRWRATGRWMVREVHVTKPGETAVYGPDLVDRWKGRAFQQSPDSTISVVGFEDEQVNWEANSVLLGELTGPVRAIRETWGADSGTNVTKIETFYRDAITYRYHVRVHPIPPDGLYTSWDYNADAVSTYYNETKTEGVPVDGINDDIGHIDDAGPIGPAFFDFPDPQFTKPLAFLNWEQVSGKGDNGSLVYMFELKGPTSVVNPVVVPYYRDDSCLDDGTGDNPSPRLWPGEALEDSRLAEYRDRPCYGDPVNGTQYSNTADPALYRQGCFGCHGIHYLVTGDSDNAWTGAPSTEIDGQQWQWMVPTAAPTNVGDGYANTVKFPLVVTATPL